MTIVFQKPIFHQKQKFALGNNAGKEGNHEINMPNANGPNATIFHQLALGLGWPLGLALGLALGVKAFWIPTCNVKHSHTYEGGGMSV